MTPAKANYNSHQSAPRQSSYCVVWGADQNTKLQRAKVNFRIRATSMLFLLRNLTLQIVRNVAASFAPERPRNECEQRESECGEHCAGNDDVGPHLQSLFQFPFFQINQTVIRSPTRTSRIAISIPITHSMRFPIHESETP